MTNNANEANELKTTWDRLFPETPINPRQTIVWGMQHKPEIIKTAFFQLARKLGKLEEIGQAMSATDRIGYATTVMNTATKSNETRTNVACR